MNPLVTQDGRVYLAVPGSQPKELRAIAEIERITPAVINWRPFDWTKGKTQ
jgi:hypothetical protein